MDSFHIWLMFIVIPNIGMVASFTSVISTVSVLISGVIVCIIWASDDGPQYLTNGLTVLGGLALVLFLSTTVAVVCPDKEEMAAILFVPSVVNNKEVQKLPDNLVKYINNILEKDKGGRK